MQNQLHKRDKSWGATTQNYKSIPHKKPPSPRQYQKEKQSKQRLQSYPTHQTSLNLSGDQEHLPTDGTFAPYSVQSSQFQPGMSQEQQFLLKQSSSGNGPFASSKQAPLAKQPQTKSKKGAQQSRQSSIHMTLPSQTTIMAQSTQPKSTKTIYQRKDVGVYGRQFSERYGKTPSETRTTVDGASVKKFEHNPYEVGNWRTTPNEAASSKSTSFVAAQRRITVVSSSRQSSCKETHKTIGPGEQTLTRNQDMKEKWVDMPLSTENTSRTHRSYFQMATGQQQEESQRHSTIRADQSQTIDVIAKRKTNGGRQRMSPQFASFHNGSTQMEPRSMTPYLGTGSVEEEAPNKKGDTHQLLMMTASSIPPMSIDNDNDSQKQTQRSVILNQTLLAGEHHLSDDRMRNKEAQRIPPSSHTADHPYRDNQRRWGADKDQSLSMVPGSEHGAAYRDAHTRSSQDFKRKLGHLKQALSTIKTNLTSFKQSASAKHLQKTASLPRRSSQDQGKTSYRYCDRSRASVSNGSNSRFMVQDKSSCHCCKENSLSASQGGGAGGCCQDNERYFRSKSHPIFPADDQSQHTSCGHVRKPSNFNFSELNNSKQAIQVAKPRDDMIKLLQLTPITDSLSKTHRSTNRQDIQTLDTGRNNCQYEATGKFGNQLQSAKLGTLDNNHVGQSGLDTEMSVGETIEQVHRRHQSKTNLLDERSCSTKADKTINIMQTYDGRREVEPLNLAKLDESKSMPHITPLPVHHQGQTEGSHSCHNTTSGYQSCKHQRQDSQKLCKCCYNVNTIEQCSHRGMTTDQASNSASMSTRFDNRRNQHQSHHQQNHAPHYLTDRENFASKQSCQKAYSTAWDRKTTLEDVTEVSQQSHRYLQPQTLETSHVQSPTTYALSQKRQNTEEDKVKEVTHHSSRDQHPDNERSQRQSFVRSISTPIIVAIDEQQESINEIEVYTQASIIPDKSATAINESKYDEKGCEVAALRKKGILPGKIVRKSLLNRNSSSKDQTEHERTLKQMLELKKQLQEVRTENLKPVTVEISELQRALREVEQDRSKLRENLREEKERRSQVEDQLRHVINENNQFRAKQKTYHSQTVADFERQVYLLKDQHARREKKLNGQIQQLRDDNERLQDLLKKQELDKLQLRFELDSRQTLAGMAPNGLSSDRMRLVTDERIETRFLTELLKLIGAEQSQQNFEHLLKKLKKQQRFCHKMIKLVSDVEGRKADSLADCLSWVKGLLKDFISLRNHLAEQGKRTNQQQQPFEKVGFLSPINKDSVYSIGVENNNSSFIRMGPSTTHENPRNGRKMTQTSFSPVEQRGNNDRASTFVLSDQNINSMLDLSAQNLISRQASYQTTQIHPASASIKYERTRSHESQISSSQLRGASNTGNHPESMSMMMMGASDNQQRLFTKPHSRDRHSLERQSKERHSRERHTMQNTTHIQRDCKSGEQRPAQKKTKRKSSAGSRSKSRRKQVQSNNVEVVTLMSENRYTNTNTTTTDEESSALIQQLNTQSSACEDSQRHRKRHAARQKKKQPNQGGSSGQQHEKQHITENIAIFEENPPQQQQHLDADLLNQVVFIKDRMVINEPDQIMTHQHSYENEHPNHMVGHNQQQQQHMSTGITPYQDSEALNGVFAGGKNYHKDSRHFGTSQGATTMMSMQSGEIVMYPSSRTSSRNNGGTGQGSKTRVMSQDDNRRVRDTDRSSITQIAMGQGVYDTIQPSTSNTVTCDTVQMFTSSNHLPLESSAAHLSSNFMNNTVISGGRVTLEAQGQHPGSSQQMSMQLYKKKSSHH